MKPQETFNKHKTILVVDGQGGGCGKAIVKKLRESLPETIDIIACGTNVIATNAMIKAGANEGATGTNAIVFNANRVDLIVGVMGILIPNSMLGEYTVEMAEAVSNSPAHKIVIPMQKCKFRLAVSEDNTMGQSINILVDMVKEYFEI